MQFVIMIYYTGATIRISIKLVDNGNEGQVSEKLDGVDIVVESSNSGIMALHPDSVRESFIMSSSRKNKKATPSETPIANTNTIRNKEDDDDYHVNVRHNFDDGSKYGNDTTDDDDDDDDNVSQQSSNSKENSRVRSKEATASIATTSRRTTAERPGGPGSQQPRQSFARPQHQRQQLLEEKQPMNKKKRHQARRNPLAAVLEAAASAAAAEEEVVGVDGITISPRTKVSGWKYLYRMDPQERRDMIDHYINKRKKNKNSKTNTKNQYQSNDKEKFLEEGDGDEESELSKGKEQDDQDQQLPPPSSELQQLQQQQRQFEDQAQRPSFASIVKDGNVEKNVIIGDPQFLLDFAIIGHGTYLNTTYDNRLFSLLINAFPFCILYFLLSSFHLKKPNVVPRL